MEQKSALSFVHSWPQTTLWLNYRDPGHGFNGEYACAEPKIIIVPRIVDSSLNHDRIPRGSH